MQQNGAVTHSIYNEWQSEVTAVYLQTAGSTVRCCARDAGGLHCTALANWSSDRSAALDPQLRAGDMQRIYG